VLIPFKRCALAFGFYLIAATCPAWGQALQSEQGGVQIETSLSAEELAELVLKANPGLLSATAAAEAAAYRMVPAGSLDDPVLSYGVAPFTMGSGRLNQKIDFSQRLPWPGTLTAREAVAQNEANVVSSDVDALRLRLIAQAKSAYAEWRFVDEALTIHHATRELLDKLITTAQIRYTAGRALKQDVLQAELELANLDKHEFGLLRQQSTVMARVNALLNRPPDMPLPRAAPIKIHPVIPDSRTLEELALAQHPELARLEAHISANRSRVILAEKAFYPDFQVGVTYNSLWDDSDKRTIVGASMNVPLNRRKRRAVLSRAKAETQSAEWSLVERRADLLADIAQARAEVIESQDSVHLYEDQLVALAQEYLAAAVADYQSGTGGFLNVINAQQRTLNTDLALARARADYARRLAGLERVVGVSLIQFQRLTTGEQR
jgi:cobalt-zinc-cadmium efflux system outer membrane protein